MKAKRLPAQRIDQQIDPTRVYPVYENGTTLPVIEYYAVDGRDRIGPFLTWGAANHVLQCRVSVRESQAKRTAHRQALAA